MMDQTGLMPVEVTVRFDLDGRMQPIKFTWLGSQIPVASTGRRWKDDAGQHILVMDHQAIAYELIFSSGEMRWFLRNPGRIRKNILPT